MPVILAQTPAQVIAATSVSGLLPQTAGVAASAGTIGELLIVKNNGGGSAVSLVTATAKTVVSLALTAGDWEVSSLLGILPANTTNVVFAEASLSLTDNTAANVESGDYAMMFPNKAFTAGQFPTLTIPPKQILISAGTTLYLIARVQFSVSTLTAFGMIRARRVR